MQCIVVKGDEFENSYSLLDIPFKSCLCCCSLATLAPQQKYILRSSFERKRLWRYSSVLETVGNSAKEAIKARVIGHVRHINILKCL